MSKKEDDIFECINCRNRYCEKHADLIFECRICKQWVCSVCINDDFDNICCDKCTYSYIKKMERRKRRKEKEQAELISEVPE